MVNKISLFYLFKIKDLEYLKKYVYIHRKKFTFSPCHTMCENTADGSILLFTIIEQE